MCKKLILLCCLLLLVGCQKVTDNENYIESVNVCLSDKTKSNNVSQGYKYYLPKGVKKIQDYDYNQIFLIDDYNVYLYVDIISYFYEKNLQNVEVEDDIYYYETIDYNGKKGYIKINKVHEDNYFINIVYHYSKIEANVPKDKLNKVITLSSIILNSIEYNDSVIEKILEGDFGEFSEFNYEVDKPEGASSNFSQILEEYVQKEESTEQLPDE